MARAANSRIVPQQQWPSHLFDRLPFVMPMNPGTPRNFWAPRSTGDFVFDCSLGKQYADALLALPRSPDQSANLLTQTVLAIMDHGNTEADRGVIVGLFHGIGEALVQPGMLQVTRPNCPPTLGAVGQR